MPGGPEQSDRGQGDADAAADEIEPEDGCCPRRRPAADESQAKQQRPAQSRLPEGEADRMAAMVGRDLGQGDGAAPDRAHQQQEPDGGQAIEADQLGLAGSNNLRHGVSLSRTFPLSSIGAKP
jgi:hypothetical protein